MPARAFTDPRQPREPAWGSPASGHAYTPGAPEFYAHNLDPEPRQVKPPLYTYGKATPQERAKNQAFRETYAQWQVREMLRRRQADITAGKLAATTERGTPARGSLWFDKQNRLVARRSPYVSLLRPVPGGSGQMEHDPAYDASPRPNGNLVIYETPLLANRQRFAR